MRRASAITMRSGFTTSRTLVRAGVGEELADAVEPVVEAARPSRTRSSPATGRHVTRDSTGDTTLFTRRLIGKTRSMYQLRMSGSDRRRIVSAVGAQSTTTTSHSPDSA